MEELAPDLWWWTASHPDWTPEDLEGGAGWEEVVSSYALVAGENLVLFDPLVEDWDWLDDQVERHGAPAIMVTILWHGRSSQQILDRYPGASLWAHEPAAEWIAERARVTRTFVPGEDLPGAVEAIPMRRIGKALEITESMRSNPSRAACSRHHGHWSRRWRRGGWMTHAS